jgi:hypothetical protein
MRPRGRPGCDQRRTIADLHVVPYDPAMPTRYLLLISMTLVPQLAPTAVDWSADDGKRVAELRATGLRREGKSVVLFTPAGELDNAAHKALLERLDRGVAELRAVVGRHKWQVVGNKKITYYISADRFVSHASGHAAVFIPMIRLRDGRAPYLHEAAHELLESYALRLTRDPA